MHVISYNRQSYCENTRPANRNFLFNDLSSPASVFQQMISAGIHEGKFTKGGNKKPGLGLCLPPLVSQSGTPSGSLPVGKAVRGAAPHGKVQSGGRGRGRSTNLFFVRQRDPPPWLLQKWPGRGQHAAPDRRDTGLFPQEGVSLRRATGPRRATIPPWLIKDHFFNMEITLMYLSELERHLPNFLINEM